MDGNSRFDEHEQDLAWREKSFWERHPSAEWLLRWYLSTMSLLCVWGVFRETAWPGLTAWAYVILGCYLSKKVLTPALGEGSYYNDPNSPISDRFWYRVRYLMFWPLAYPWLFIRLLFLKAN